MKTAPSVGRWSRRPTTTDLADAPFNGPLGHEGRLTGCWRTSRSADRIASISRCVLQPRSGSWSHLPNGKPSSVTTKHSPQIDPSRAASQVASEWRLRSRSSDCAASLCLHCGARRREAAPQQHIQPSGFPCPGAWFLRAFSGEKSCAHSFKLAPWLLPRRPVTGTGSISFAGRSSAWLSAFVGRCKPPMRG